MRSKILVLVAKITFPILALGFVWYNVQSNRKAGISLNFLNQKIVLLDTSIQRAQKQIAGSQRNAAAIQDKLKNLQSAKDTTKAVATDNLSRFKDDATLLEYDPKLRDLWLKWRRTVLVRHYGSMYQALGLTQVQIDRFEELATAKEDDTATIRAGALAQGLSLFDPDYIALQKQSTDRFYAAVANEVSAAVPQEMIQLDRIEGAQVVVGGVISMIAPGTSILTSSQAEQLARILANSSASYQNGGDANQNDINWDNAYGQAAEILSGPQLQAFKAEVENNRLLAKVKQFYSQQQAGSP